MTIYLYKKTHNKTGLQYLGKTSQNPHKYKGSGMHWCRHITKHGYDVTTEILRECSTNDEIKEWGIYYSELWDVVGSNDWANLKPESGAGGFGKLSAEAKKKGVATRRANGTYVNTPEATRKRLDSMAKNGTTHNQTEESIKKQLDTKASLGITNKGRKHTKEELLKMRDSHLGSKNKAAKLTENNVVFIKNSKLLLRELAAMFNVSISTISHIRNGRIWSHVSV